MRIILIVLCLLVTTNCYASAKLFRYTDKVTGDEIGICYSDIYGNNVNNPDWNCEEISEKDKLKYIELQEKQHKDKRDVIDTDKKNKKKSIRNKLKDTLTKDELDVLLGETD